MYNNRAPFDFTYLTSYVMTIVIFVISLTICEIFPNKEKFQNVDIENGG